MPPLISNLLCSTLDHKQFTDPFLSMYSPNNSSFIHIINTEVTYQSKLPLLSSTSISNIMIRFILLVNKQGQTRLSSYYTWLSMEERIALESEIIRKCLARTDTNQCSFIDYKTYRVVYRRYASLYFIVGVDSTSMSSSAAAAASASTNTSSLSEPAATATTGDDDNELGVLEFIHALVETLDKYFENVCELDIMFALPTAHHILDEMVMNGYIIETNRANILKPIQLQDKTSAR